MFIVPGRTELKKTGVLLNSKMFVTSAALAEVSAPLNIKCHSGCVNLSQSA